ncbi:helix-turn-helix domain-containing protein [Pediococcus pentosaceus]|uniref:helix-turn-helix domain-containing protein n=1 Tax=Pediococcus pentosaceus TaxID=1255 RepID=UPI002D7E9E7D|nr:helix-turn-helix domain-containing protein [Pediococcus pentosaceus]
MKTFLTATSLKKVVLLDYLLESGAWCSTKELAKVIGVTDKSILNYLEEFKQLFKSTDQKIRLFNDHNKNFRIIKEEDFPIYTIYLKFYQASYNYKLIDFMYHNPHQRLADYADSQFTSISTVFRYAKLLKSYFKRYKIQFLPYKLELKGDEINIRSFYYYFYWNSTREMRNNWPFNTELAKLDEYIANFEEIYGISLDPIQRKKFAYWLVITLERSQITLLNIKSAKKQIINNDPNFDLMWQWNKKGELTLNQDELYFLYQVIYVFGIIDGNPNYENSYALAHQKNQTHAYQAVMNLALVIKKTFNFQLGTTDLELMFNFIAFHEHSTFFMEILTCFSTVPT